MKLVKSYLYIILSSFILLNGCDVVDDHRYYMGDSADDIFSNPTGIAAASMGLYDALQNSEFLGGRAQIYVDIRGIDVNPPTYFGNMSTFQNTSSDATTADAWEGGYRTIYECNLFLEGIETAKNNSVITEKEYSTYAADARFIRSVVYFYMLNLWGQMYVLDSENLGIPLVTKAYDGTNAFTEPLLLKRSSIEDCYQFIESDLLYAEENLPENRLSGSENLGLATSGSAQAMLSRVYLYQKQYDKVISYANRLTDRYTLTENAISNFTAPATSEEVIFFIAMNSMDNPNTNNALGQHYGATYRADITVSNSYLELLDESDVRSKDFIVQNTNGAWFCYKYRNGSRDWAPVIRYAEVLLNKAEALVKSTNSINQEAIELLNEVHQRSNSSKTYVTSDFSSASALLEEILTERRRELAFEGHGSFDLFRNEKGIPAGRGAATAAEIPYPSNYFALPIPNSDIEKSSGVLVQNKGY